MNVHEFRREIAKQEHVQIPSIHLVDFDATKYAPGDQKDTDVKMNGLYTNNIVKY